MLPEFPSASETSAPPSGLSPQNANLLDTAWDVVKDSLKELALAPNAYDRLDFVFDIPDPSVAEALLADWGNGIFPSLPNVVVVPDATLNGNAGAYSADRSEIYLSASLVQSDNLTGILPKVLAEEFGHHVDQLLNPGGDTVGDEGELFSDILLGEELTDEELARLRGENDFGILNLDGKDTFAEFTSTFTWGGRTYQWVSYRIQSGDTLSGIASRTLGDGSYNAYSYIGNYNGITNYSRIYAGQSIYVPSPYTAPPTNNTSPPSSGTSSLPPVMTTTEFNNWPNMAEYTSRNPFPSKGQNQQFSL
ncbi:MAG: LysM peptidoglycan-binding domain-containing protein [Prochlorotrichaceae cyanobacterium]|jgi:nucleoid-associated protein YgaU